MFVFDPFVLLFWVFVSSFIPGALLSLGMFTDSKFKLIEKILIGFSIGLIIPPSLLLFANLIGIKFSFTLAIASVVLFYLLSAAAFLKRNGYDSIKHIPVSLTPELFKDQEKIISFLITLFLGLIVILAFWVRLQSYSPIFQELDPYYYTYSSYQILGLGEPPFDDQTAWYPDVKVSHRTVPVLTYLESLWYSLYTQGSAPIDNYLLSGIAGIYPPIAASLAVFGLYFLFAANYRREFALIGAAVASFLIIFVLKLSAGEMEVQPFGFFTVSLSLALYAWLLKERSTPLKLPLLLSLFILYFGLMLGSSSVVVFNSAVLIFFPIYFAILFVKRDFAALMDLAKIHFLFALVSLYISAILLSVFVHGSGHGNATNLFIPSPIALVILAESFACFVLHQILVRYVKDTETTLYVLFGAALAGAAAFLFTPFGNIVKGIGVGALRAATFDTALKRTIAEQGTAGGAFQGQLGFIAYFPQEIANTILNPATFGPLNSLLAGLLSIILGLLSFLSNLFFKLFAFVLNAILEAGIEYEDKQVSLFMAVAALILIGLTYSFIRFLKKSDSSDFNSILYFALLFPPAIVGIVKAKFTIYMGFFFAGAIAVFLGEALNFISQVAKSASTIRTSYLVLLFLGISIVLLQFTHDEFSIPALSGSMKPRFQDNPLALKSKLTYICNQLKVGGGYDEEICSAAQDPVAFASKGTNYQFNNKLCSVSVQDNPFAPSEIDVRASSFRCQRVADYWIESMEWLRFNTESDSRTTSWWDYGHWINYFGLKDSVLRNEHLSLEMIGAVANAYLDGTPEDLASLMKKYDSKYALFDGELLYGGNTLGGKYGALNYLSCDYAKQTDVNTPTGSSICEFEHLWETVYIPKTQPGQSCTISQGKSGLTAYKFNVTRTADGSLSSKLVPVYCAGDVTLVNGQRTTGLYRLNDKYENGDLKLHKAILKYDYDTEDGISIYTTFYTKDALFIDNGQITSGYEDRVGKFYESNLYRAFFLNELPGFDLVFTSKNGEVKIYKLRE